MLNVSDEVKAAFKSGTATRNILITFPDLGLTLTNDQIQKDSIKLVEAIESEKYLNFTGCKSSRFEFTCLDLKTDIRGEAVSVTISAGPTSMIPLFSGYVSNVSNENHEDIATEVVCYDLLHRVNERSVAAWYNGLTFPMTVKDLRDSLAVHCGLTQETTTLSFDNFQIEKTIDPDEMSAKDVLVCICQANGVFARINRSGNLEYVKLSTSTPETITADIYSDASYENFTTAPIDKVQIRTDEDDIGGVYGTGTNCYVVENNFLFFGQSASSLASIAQTIYGLVAGFTYYPYDLDLAGLPYMEPGDYITFATKNNTVTSYILSRTLSGLPELKDNYSADGNKNRSSQINSVNSQITQLKGKANRLTRTVEETNSRITDVESGLESQITQTKDSIELQITDLQNQIDGSINFYYRDGEPTLENYPAWDFTYNIPVNGTVQTTDTLQFQYTKEYYQKNVRALCYDNVNATTYRFRTSDAGSYYWEIVENTEYAVLIQRITALEVSDGEIKSSIEEVEADVSQNKLDIITNKSSIKQNADSISTEVTRASKAEGDLSSAITQTAEGILATVAANYPDNSTFSSQLSQTSSSILATVSGTYATQDSVSASLELKIDKDDDDQIVSMLNASADVITLTSNRLEISSDNFTLDKDGTMTAKNGNFTGKVTATSGSFTGEVNATSGSFSGEIKANSGTIAGWTIASDGIYKQYNGYCTKIQSDGTIVSRDSSNNVMWALQKDGNAQFNGSVTIAGYATSSELKAVSANVSTLTAKAITTDNFSAQTINASKITSGTLNSARLDVSTLVCSKVRINGSNYGFKLVPFSVPTGFKVTIGSKTYTCEATGSTGYQCFGNT